MTQPLSIKLYLNDECSQMSKILHVVEPIIGDRKPQISTKLSF